MPKPDLAELLAKRWPNFRLAEDWVRAARVNLDAMGLRVGMANDQGVGLVPAMTPPDPVGDDRCTIRIACATTRAYALAWAQHYAAAIGTPMAVFDAQDRPVGQFEGAAPIRPEPFHPEPRNRTNGAPVDAPHAPDAVAAIRPIPPARKAPTGDPGPLARKARRKVTYETMRDLALREEGVTGAELTRLNDGQNEPWAAYMKLAAARFGLAMPLPEKRDRLIVYTLRHKEAS